MNTDTGRIYDLRELYPDDADRLDALRAQAVDGDADTAGYSAVDAPLTTDEQRLEFERALRAGDAVPVSAKVAQQAKLGQRELTRRKRRAARDARRRNR